MTKKTKPLNYYFLQKHIHPKAPPGYRENIAALIVNGDGKYLLVKENIGFWNIPKKALKGENVFEGLLNALVEDLGGELGFKGVVVKETKPQFILKSILFDFGKQVYDEARSKDEAKKGRPTKGKIYHLVIVHYDGPDELPIGRDGEDVTIMDYVWATEDQFIDLVTKNLEIRKDDPNYSKESAKHNLEFSKNLIATYKQVSKIQEDNERKGQLSLI